MENNRQSRMGGGRVGGMGILGGKATKDLLPNVWWVDLEE